GPISVAVYAAGTTFGKTLEVIFHLRECGLNNIPTEEELSYYKPNCVNSLEELDVLDDYRYHYDLGYPSFLKMLQKADASKSNRKRVYVLPVFEVSKTEVLPNHKKELVLLLKKKKAFIFHENFCKACHEIPLFKVCVRFMKLLYQTG
ncbi:hypothetical protein Avbf_10717, partial [Armadillidium vulgare]